MLERQLQVGLVEEFRIGQAGADDPLVAGHDGVAAIGGDVVGGQQEAVGQLALGIAQAEAFLVGADGGDDRLFRHGEEILVEGAHHDDRPFDEAGDFLEQALIGDDGETVREGEVVGVGADDVLAAVEVEHDLGLFEGGRIIVEAADPDRRRSEEAVTESGLAGLDGVGGEGDHHRVFVLAAESGGDGADGTHPGQPAMAPLHRLRPGEGIDDARQDGGEEARGFGALLLDHGDVGVALLGIGLDFRLLDRAQAGGFQEAVDGGLRGADARALLFFLEVGRAGRDAGDGERKAARRDEGAGAFVEQPGVDEGVGDGLFQVLGGAALEARWDFLGEQFEQQFGHFSPAWLGGGRVSKQGEDCPMVAGL